jgi:hypothetical protein
MFRAKIESLAMVYLLNYMSSFMFELLSMATFPDSAAHLDPTTNPSMPTMARYTGG